MFSDSHTKIIEEELHLSNSVRLHNSISISLHFDFDLISSTSDNYTLEGRYLSFVVTKIIEKYGFLVMHGT